MLKVHLESWEEGWNMRKVTSSFLAVAFVCLSVCWSVQNVYGQSQGLIREIRHELVTLPYYDVFDWLEGEVRPDGTVILRGEVVRPSTRSDARSRVERIEGVTRVVNQIVVLPVSQNDDRIRFATYRAIFGDNSPLFRYAHRAVPPIHIIVQNGRITLKGVVATEQEKNLAFIRARGVPGAFEVRNELRVGNES